MTTCPICQKPFTKAHHNQKYCSQKCTNRSYDITKREKRKGRTDQQVLERAQLMHDNPYFFSLVRPYRPPKKYSCLRCGLVSEGVRICAQCKIINRHVGMLCQV